jgi:hypothetical protein
VRACQIAAGCSEHQQDKFSQGVAEAISDCQQANQKIQNASGKAGPGPNRISSISGEKAATSAKEACSGSNQISNN